MSGFDLINTYSSDALAQGILKPFVAFTHFLMPLPRSEPVAPNRPYVCMYVCIYVYVYVCMYVCMYVYMCVCMYMYVCVYVCIYVCVYVCMCVCMYICVYVCICMYVCVYLHRSIHVQPTRAIHFTFPFAHDVYSCGNIFTHTPVTLGW